MGEWNPGNGTGGGGGGTATGVSNATTATIAAGTGGSSGDIVFETNGVEAMRITFPDSNGQHTKLGGNLSITGFDANANAAVLAVRKTYSTAPGFAGNNGLYQTVSSLNVTLPVGGWGTGISEFQGFLAQAMDSAGGWTGTSGENVGAIHGQAKINTGITTGFAQAATFEAISQDTTADGLLLALEATIINLGTTPTSVDDPKAKINYWGASSGRISATITGAVSNGASGITITAASHGFSNGDPVTISGVTGTTEANTNGASGTIPTWTIFNVTTNTFDIPVAFVHAYISGGTAVKTPASTAFMANANSIAGWLNGIRLRNVGITPGSAFVQLLQPSVPGVYAIDIKNSAAGNWAHGNNTGVINLPNTGYLSAYSADGSTLYRLAGLDGSNNVQIAPDGQPVVFSGAAGVFFESSIQIAAANIITDTTTGMQIATATAQKIGFYGVTPVVQPSGSSDVLASLVTLGLRAASSNPPLNLGTGALTAGTTSLGATTVSTLATSGNPGNLWPTLGALKNVQVFKPGTGQTWTKPAGATVAVVIIKGAGGGGGGGTTGANSVYGGAGGGAGGWCTFAVPLADLASSVTINVASGGAAGAAGSAGGNASGTTAFDSTGGNANVTAANGGAAGGVSSPAGGSGGVATAPTYSGFAVSSVATNGGAGGGSSITTTASAGTVGSGGGGGGISAAPAAETGGAGSETAPTTGTNGAGGTTGQAGAPSVGTPHYAGVQQINGGGGGGANIGGSNAGAGGDGFAAGGGGGGGSCVTGGTAGAGGKGGDGVVVVLCY